MARTLDRQRPYGMIYPPGAAHFVQDGVHFGPDGSEVALTGSAPQESAIPAAAQPKAKPSKQTSTAGAKPAE